MSRIGKLPIALPKGIDVKINSNVVEVSNGKDKMTFNIPFGINVKVEESVLTVVKNEEGGKYDALFGTVRAILSNMVTGLSKGFEKRMELVGIGYKAQANEKELTLNLGYSHPVVYPIPAGVSVVVEANTKLLLKSFDKQLLGQTCAEIRSYRKPEPYKGKGIRYQGETIMMKAGKRSK